MYAYGDQIPNGATIRGFDICIVGAGAAGIAMATRLIGSSKQVLLVSSGLSTDRGLPAPIRESIYEGSIGPFMQKVDKIFLTRSRLRMYGGTTNHFGFWARPLDEADLRSRPGYRSAYWPIDMASLNQYYPDANAFGNFGPFNYDDIDYWAQVLHGTPFPSRPGDSLQNAIFHAQYDANIHDFQVRYGEELRLAENVTVLFNANALNIASTPDKRFVTSITCRTIENNQAGRTFYIQSGSYVLAQGGIESVRLLKLSNNLGDNAKGQLGRGFMVHPLITNAAQVDFREPVSPLIRNFFRDQQVKIPTALQANEEAAPRFSPVYHVEDLDDYYIFNAWGALAPTPYTMEAEAIGNFRINFGFNFNGTSTVINFNWEQVPNENSFITLDTSKRDPVFSQPVVGMDWNLLEQEKRTIQKGLELCRNYLAARGAANFQILTDLSGGPEHWTFAPDNPNDGRALRTGDHHMGATRMSTSASDGIVDTNLRSHMVNNLYLVGCNVFPTSGYANPTLTLVALALRLADHLKQQPPAETPDGDGDPGE